MIEEDNFRTILYFKDVFTEVPVKSSVKSSVKIIELILKNNSITIPEMANELNMTTRGVEKILKRLKNEQKIQRIGPDKGGYWKVVQKGLEDDKKSP